jgi:sialic acid synthase SpsE
MYLISELHGQYGGDLATAEQMILQSKMFGAHAVKVQLYDPIRLNQNRRHQYLSLTFDQLKHLQAYAGTLGIDFFASFFDEQRLDWCLQLDFPVLKIASIALERYPDLCQAAVDTGKRTLVSLGTYDWQNQPPPFDAPNVEYLYCVAKYPATLEDIHLPDFRQSFFSGYSDHAPGTTASMVAIARGAEIVEKHFTLSHTLQKDTEKAHTCGMTFEELRAIRAFWDDVRILDRRGYAYAGFGGSM